MGILIKGACNRCGRASVLVDGIFCAKHSSQNYTEIDTEVPMIPPGIRNLQEQHKAKLKAEQERAHANAVFFARVRDLVDPIVQKYSYNWSWTSPVTLSAGGKSVELWEIRDWRECKEKDRRGVFIRAKGIVLFCFPVEKDFPLNPSMTDAEIWEVVEKALRHEFKFW